MESPRLKNTAGEIVIPGEFIELYKISEFETGEEYQLEDSTSKQELPLSDPQSQKLARKMKSFLAKVGVKYNPTTEIFDDTGLQDPIHCYDNVWLALQATEYLMQKNPLLSQTEKQKGQNMKFFITFLLFFFLHTLNVYSYPRKNQDLQSENSGFFAGITHNQFQIKNAGTLEGYGWQAGIIQKTEKRNYGFLTGLLYIDYMKADGLNPDHGKLNFTSNNQ